MAEPSRKLSSDEVTALEGLKTGDLSKSIKSGKDVEVKNLLLLDLMI